MGTNATKSDLKLLEIRIDDHFTIVDERFQKIDKQFDKLTTIIVKGFDRIDRTLETKADKNDVDKIVQHIDSLEKRMEISDDERLVMNMQLNRIHNWIEQATERINVKFVH